MGDILTSLQSEILIELVLKHVNTCEDNIQSNSPE